MAGCRGVGVGAGATSQDSVSIPSRPRGRLQAGAERRVLLEGEGFNPQPAPWPAAGRAQLRIAGQHGVSIPSRPRGRLQDARRTSACDRPTACFNPQPAPWPAAGHSYHSAVSNGPSMFQSPAGPVAGCRPTVWTDGSSCYWFQSPAGPVAGCRSRGCTSRRGCSRFNPQPAPWPAAGPRPRLSFSLLLLAFQSPAGPVAGCRQVRSLGLMWMGMFQSPAGPVAGCRVWRRAATTSLSVRFQSPAGPVAGCRHMDGAAVVYVEDLFQSPAGPVAGCRPGRRTSARRCGHGFNGHGFNPQPAPWPAAGCEARMRARSG